MLESDFKGLRPPPRSCRGPQVREDAIGLPHPFQRRPSRRSPRIQQPIAAPSPPLQRPTLTPQPAKQPHPQAADPVACLLRAGLVARSSQVRALRGPGCSGRISWGVVLSFRAAGRTLEDVLAARGGRGGTTPPSNSGRPPKRSEEEAACLALALGLGLGRSDPGRVWGGAPLVRGFRGGARNWRAALFFTELEPGAGAGARTARRPETEDDPPETAATATRPAIRPGPFARRRRPSPEAGANTHRPRVFLGKGGGAGACSISGRSRWGAVQRRAAGTGREGRGTT